MDSILQSFFWVVSCNFVQTHTQPNVTAIKSFIIGGFPFSHLPNKQKPVVFLWVVWFGFISPLRSPFLNQLSHFNCAVGSKPNILVDICPPIYVRMDSEILFEGSCKSEMTNFRRDKIVKFNINTIKINSIYVKKYINFFEFKRTIILAS